MEVLQARWRLFGHVLRREPSIPANKAMAFYFHDNAKRARGRPITTLPMTLNNDLKILQNRSISLKSQKGLETLRKIAERKQEWITFTADIKKAAEAARSDDTPSGLKLNLLLFVLSCLLLFRGKRGEVVREEREGGK